MRPKQFSAFQSHLDLAQAHWSKVVRPGDAVVDATCGNGHDTLAIAKMALHAGGGCVYGFDVQAQALAHTHERLRLNLGSDCLSRVHLFNLCHSSLASALPANSSPVLIVYNLGYLPGGDKTITTSVAPTLHSIIAAEELLAPGGLISITCYPGHAAGRVEEEALLSHAATLSPRCWSSCLHRWLNRQDSPSLLLLQKSV